MTVTVIVPTLNEESTLARLLDSLDEVRPDEVIVSDGGSTDRTIDIATGRARVVSGPASRGMQLNAGAAAASGDVLLFLHADSRLDPSAVAEVRRALADPAVPGGNFDVHFDGGTWAAGAFTWINRQRRAWGVFYGDSAMFCRREVFTELGGFRPWPLLEDYEFGRRLWRRGPLALLPTPVYVSSRRWLRAGLLPTMWSWFWVQALYLAGVSPYFLARLYRHVR